ncbi:LysR family transcriptional regulator [Caulobacter segnis]
MQQLPDFEAWAIFAKVAECGSFSEAAGELGLTKASVSRAVTRLEARLRTTLLTRTTRKLSLTDTGRAALARAARILEDGAGIEAEILDEAAIPRGPIRVACSAAFGVRALARALPEFFGLYPEIEARLPGHRRPRRLDLGRFRHGDPAGRGRGFDLEGHASGVAKAIDHERAGLLRSAMAGLRGPRTWRGCRRSLSPNCPQPIDWRLHHAQEGERLVRIEATYRFNNAAACIPLLTAGLAIAAQPEALCAARAGDRGAGDRAPRLDRHADPHPRPDAAGQDASGEGAGPDRLPAPPPGRRASDHGPRDLIAERIATLAVTVLYVAGG